MVYPALFLLRAHRDKKNHAIHHAMDRLIDRLHFQLEVDVIQDGKEGWNRKWFIVHLSRRDVRNLAFFERNHADALLGELACLVVHRINGWELHPEVMTVASFSGLVFRDSLHKHWFAAYGIG